MRKLPNAPRRRLVFALVFMLALYAVPVSAQDERLAFALGASSVAGSARAAAAQKQPNVVLILADYMGYSDIGPYGAEDIRTPALDRLAAEGTRLTEFYAAAPICSPSRAALLTGRYPARAGVHGNINVAEEEGLSTAVGTLPRWLHDAGYATAHFGKWHLGAGERGPNAHGFDRFLGFHTWTIGYHNHLTFEGEPGLYADEQIVERAGYLTEMFTDAAVDFVGRNAEGPFFLYLAYNTGLPPYQAPDLPPDRWDEGWEEKKASRATLVQMIEAMDAGIGQLLDELDRRGLADDTMVIYTHDHGGGRLVRSDPLSHGFGTLWEGGIRVPLIVRWPSRVPADTHRAGAAISMDVPATILEAVGVRSDAGSLDGVDLLPLLRGEAGAADRSLFWFSPRQQAMRRGRWKYLRDGGKELLFDLQADIGEHNNVVRDHPELARELHAELSAWVELLPESKP